MRPRDRLTGQSAPCRRHSGLGCDGRCRADDTEVAVVLLAILDASFTRAELVAWHQAAAMAMLER